MQARPREGNFPRGFFFACNILATLLLVGALLIVFLWPDKMARLHVSQQIAHMVTLNLISLLLLVAWLQRNLSGAWRALTLAGTFIVLTESWLVGLT